MAQSEDSINDQFSYSYDLNYYFNPFNIKEQDFILEVFNYFESGPGMDYCPAIDFLNILYWHYRFTSKNRDKTYDAILQIDKSIDDDAGRHMLVGLLLKWNGGIPVAKTFGSEQTFLKLLEAKYNKVINTVNETYQDIANRGLTGERVPEHEKIEAEMDFKFVNELDLLVRVKKLISATPSTQPNKPLEIDPKIQLNSMIQESGQKISSLNAEIEHLKMEINLYKFAGWFKQTGIWYTVVAGAFAFGFAFGTYKFDNEKISLSDQVRAKDHKIDSLNKVITDKKFN